MGKLRDESPEPAHMQITSHQPAMMNEVTGHSVIQQWTMSRNPEEWENRQEKLRVTGYKIESRLMSVRDEYDEKICDCTMRLDGMVMSTQWVNLCSKLLQ
jgi:hypothetical protein